MAFVQDLPTTAVAVNFYDVNRVRLAVAALRQRSREGQPLNGGDRADGHGRNRTVKR